jgi:hypothetical protein
MRLAALLLGLVATAGALPLAPSARGTARGAPVSLVGETEGQDPDVVQVPVRGPEQAEANAAALKIDKDMQEQAREEAKERVKHSREFSKSAAKMTTRGMDSTLSSMDDDKRPIDVMTGKYKALSPERDELATPKSVADAEAHEEHIAHMEKAMKAKEKETSGMLETSGNQKIPTMEGLRQAIDTTIRANMKSEVAKMPYAGMKSWDDVLPMDQRFNDLPGSPIQGDKKSTAQDTIDAESKMLTERQDAVANQEKKLAEEKQLLKGQMVKVAQAANHMQDKFQDEEDGVKQKAQKKVHDAAFAMDQAMREKTLAEDDINKAKAQGGELKGELTDALKAKIMVEKAAQHDMETVKHDASLAESIALQKLKKLSQTKIHAMANAASKIAKQLFEARDQSKRDQAEIKYLKSKIYLQDRRNQREQEKIATRIERKESKFWNGQLSVVEKDSNKEKLNLKEQLTKAEEQEAKVARSALNSQKAMQQMKLPLDAAALAKKISFKDREQIKKLTKENSVLKAKVQELEKSVMRAERGQMKMGSMLHGKDEANAKLLSLIKSVNKKKEEAETAAEQNAAQVEIDEQRIADQKGHLDVANMTASSYNRLLETPCSGSSCVSMQDAEFDVEIPLVKNTQLIFPEALTPKEPKV